MSAPAARAHCGFTRGELISMLNDVRKKNGEFTDYFFLNGEPIGNFTTRVDLNGALVRCKDCGHPISEHAAQESRGTRGTRGTRRQREEITDGCLCVGIIPRCKKKLGLRSLIYSSAQKHGAMYTTANPKESIAYPRDSDDLHFTLYFDRSVGSASGFREEVLSLLEPPASMTNVTCDIQLGASPPVAALFVKRTDYDPEDCKDSPFHSLACLTHLSSASPTVTVPPDSDLFKYQMLEDPNMFDVNPERAHIVRNGIRFRGDQDADNFLALFRLPMHQYFDGIGTVGNVPLVVLTAGAVGARDPSTKRTPVDVIIECKNSSAYIKLRPFMKQGSRFNEADKTITATVHVLNPAVFSNNLRIKAEKTRKQWSELESSPVEGTVRVEGVEGASDDASDAASNASTQ